jgi:hypothetical protein
VAELSGFQSLFVFRRPQPAGTGEGLCYRWLELPQGNGMETSGREKRKFLTAPEKGMGVVIIPFDYEQLPESQRNTIIPICIASIDRHGNQIAPIWFEKGVAPVQEQLCSIARVRLGDVRRVSELAEITIHKLWERHGEEVGIWPWRRVLVRAMWEARDLAAGDSRWHINHTVPLALDSLEGDLHGPKRYEEIYQQQLLLDLVERRIEQDRCKEIREVFKMLRQGYTWEEVAQRLGQQKPEALKKRFWRWMKRNFPQRKRLHPVRRMP